jgi:hypothetical protein
MVPILFLISALKILQMMTPPDRDKIDRDSTGGNHEEYYAPLKGPRLKQGMEIYLGLAHGGDFGGTKKRIKMASQVIRKFGISTECGLSRTPF